MSSDNVWWWSCNTSHQCISNHKTDQRIFHKHHRMDAGSKQLCTAMQSAGFMVMACQVFSLVLISCTDHGKPGEQVRRSISIHFIDSFTVSLHSPNGRHLQMPAVRAVQRDCQWHLKNGGNCHQSCKPAMQWDTRQSRPIFRATNHKRVMPAKWKPYLIPQSVILPPG